MAVPGAEKRIEEIVVERAVALLRRSYELVRERQERKSGGKADSE